MFHARKFNHAINSYETWLKALEKKPGFQAPVNAWVGIHAVLQTLRGRLTVEEVLHFSAQIPLIVHSVFFEAGKPDFRKQKMDRQEVYDLVTQCHNEHSMQADPALLAERVFKIINRYIDLDQVSHVKAVLPPETLWPAQKAA